MNAIEERVYTLTDNANTLAAELYSSPEAIRYDPVGSTPDDAESMNETCGLLRQALERAKAIDANTGKG